jgi:hypothetical protein
MRRAPVVAAVYVGMSWPYFYALPMMHWAEGYATFHRWPILVYLYCLVGVGVLDAVRIPPYLQVLVPLVLAPIFGDTVDSLHRTLGLPEDAAQGVLSDPSLLLLEPTFYWSVGDKLYFAACYLFSYHYLAHKSKMVAKATSQQGGIRILACLGFALITFLWQSLTLVNDPMQVEETLSEWPQFCGKLYAINVGLDWVAMALLVVGVGSGNYLLRLLGESMLGTMISHMYLALPFPEYLTLAMYYGGVLGVLIVFFTLPVIWILTFGAGFQYVCLKVIMAAVALISDAAKCVLRGGTAPQ